MSDFAGMEDLLQDFLQEAGELLSDVDNKLVDLERSPDDHRLLNDIFRGFHTIKGGAGFLNAGELVSLCHLTENLFDRLRNAALTLTPALMDTIMAATQSVRNMFGEIAQGRQPDPAPLPVMANLRAALAVEEDRPPSIPLAASRKTSAPATAARAAAVPTAVNGPDWQALHAAVTGQTPVSIRVDTARLDQVLNLSGEIGLTKNRLNQPAQRHPRRRTTPRPCTRSIRR
jgi:two-component system chemotaxis sensor kinase CheA